MKIEIKERPDGKIIKIEYANGDVVYVRTNENRLVNVNYADSSIQLQCGASNEVTILPR